MRFAVDFSKTFTGSEALTAQSNEELHQRLVLFSIPDGAPLLLYDEPIYRDGEVVGETTSGVRAFRVGGSLAFGLVRHAPACTRDFIRDGSYEIRVGDEYFPASPLARAPYDPSGARMKL